MRIKQLRIERELLQKDVAAMLSVNRTTYGKYETGDAVPPLDNLIKLADYYGVSLDYLVGRPEGKEAKTTPRLSHAERQLVENFRQLSPQGQEYIQQTMAMAVHTYKRCSDLSDMENDEMKGA